MFDLLGVKGDYDFLRSLITEKNVIEIKNMYDKKGNTRSNVEEDYPYFVEPTYIQKVISEKIESMRDHVGEKLLWQKRVADQIEREHEADRGIEII